MTRNEYQEGIQAAAAALAVMLAADHTPAQVMSTVQTWLASHGKQWTPPKGNDGPVPR